MDTELPTFYLLDHEIHALLLELEEFFQRRRVSTSRSKIIERSDAAHRALRYELVTKEHWYSLRKKPLLRVEVAARKLADGEPDDPYLKRLAVSQEGIKIHVRQDFLHDKELLSFVERWRARTLLVKKDVHVSEEEAA